MIKHHIKRSYMIILGIACSVTMMFCMIQMGDSINNKYKYREMQMKLEAYQKIELQVCAGTKMERVIG
ncbi:MAG: hypothetical protein HDQ98_02550 [Lachnospiraceae bacterium]|nr:hypothetical protein [Lachnospiraceae bacterium]